jgi:catecholate siderophore receptor
VLTRGTQNKIQSMENLFAQSDLSTKFEALGLKHEVLTGVDFAWEKKIVRGGSGVPGRRHHHHHHHGGTGWVDEDARVIGKTSEFESLSGGVYAQDLIQVAPTGSSSPACATTACRPSTTPSTANAVTNYQQAIYKMSKRFGVLFQPSDRHSFHLSYGTSFNTSGDTYSYSAVNTPPEKSMNVELGAKIDSADRRMSSRFALFRGVKLNERNTDPLLNIAVLSGKRHATGFETDVIGKITPRWESMAPTPGSGTPRSTRAPKVPKARAAPVADPEAPGHPVEHLPGHEKLRVGAGANARTKMTPNRNPGLYSDGYITYDAMAEYEAIQDKLTLKANLINLTNKFYADSLYANGHYVPGFGRTVYLTGSLKF